VFAKADHVSIVTRGGQRFDSGPIAHAKGSFEARLTRTELFDKFVDCLGSGVDTGKAQRLFDRCFELNEAPSLDALRAGIGDIH
jgi:hypothetical protein